MKNEIERSASKAFSPNEITLHSHMHGVCGSFRFALLSATLHLNDQSRTVHTKLSNLFNQIKAHWGNSNSEKFHCTRDGLVVCEFFPLPRNFPGALEKKFFYCASSSPPLSFLLCAQQNYVFTLKFKQQTLVFLLGLCFAAVVYLNTVNIFTAEKAPRRGKNLELQSAAVAAAPLLL